MHPFLSSRFSRLGEPVKNRTDASKTAAAVRTPLRVSPVWSPSNRSRISIGYSYRNLLPFQKVRGMAFTFFLLPLLTGSRFSPEGKNATYVEKWRDSSTFTVVMIFTVKWWYKRQWKARSQAPCLSTWHLRTIPLTVFPMNRIRTHNSNHSAVFLENFHFQAIHSSVSRIIASTC
jgi:hypothetical protein